jgi:hypothetical protein
MAIPRRLHSMCHGGPPDYRVSGAKNARGRPASARARLDPPDL